jgi:hypothetical protein
MMNIIKIYNPINIVISEWTPESSDVFIVRLPYSVQVTAVVSVTYATKRTLGNEHQTMLLIRFCIEKQP